MSSKAYQSPSSQLASISITTLAALRIVTGAASLLAPRTTGSMFGLSISPESAVLGRLFAVRDVVIGSLLWTAKSENERRNEVKRALWANVVTDSVDVCSCLLAAADGTMDKNAAGLVVGGAVLFIIFGVVGLSVV